jgi:hypothetical protein
MFTVYREPGSVRGHASDAGVEILESFGPRREQVSKNASEVRVIPVTRSVRGDDRNTGRSGRQLEAG